MKANEGSSFVPLAVCALLAAGFANGARAPAGPAQTLLDGKVVGNLGGFIVGTDFKASLNGESTEQSRDRLRQDLRRRQRPVADPRRPALAHRAEPSPALPLLRRLDSRASASSTRTSPGATTSSPPAARSG